MGSHTNDHDFPMPTHINILFDDLFVDHSHSIGGNTEPSILNGLLGNVTFQPWVGFRKVVCDALDVLNGLTSEQLVEVEASLHKARRFIEESRKDHMMCLELQRKRKAQHDFKVVCKATRPNRSLHLTHGMDDMVISNKDVGRTSSEAIVNEEPQHLKGNGSDAAESSSSEDEVANWRVELPVNTSSSILDLHKDIFDALRELLRLMYPEDLLRLDLKTISSENLFGEKRGKMLYEYMCKIVEDHKALQTAEVTSGAMSNRTEEATSLAQKTVGSEDRSKDSPLLHHENEAVEAIDSQRKEEKIRRATRRSARLEEKSNTRKKEDAAAKPEVVPVRPVVRLSQTPDRALFRIAENDGGAVPVCCYEYKAPALDLSGLYSPKPSTQQQTNEPENSHTSLLHDSRREDTIGQEDDGQSEDSMYIPGLSAKVIASEYDRLLKNPSHMDKKRPEFANERAVLLPIAQVICQALLSKTGCVFLTNHQMSFALRVEENTEVFGAKVFVTGAIPSNQVPGQFAAMLGFSKYCMDRVKNEKERDLLDTQRRLLTSLSYKTYHADITDEQLDPDWCPLGPSHDGGTVGSKSGTRYARNRGARDLVAEETDMSLSTYNGKVLSDRTNALALPELNTAKRTSRSPMDEQLKAMFATTEEVLGVGATGVIIRGVWQGKKVAIKMWNGHSRDGFLSIRREIHIYDRLQEKCPSILGRAVPGYVLGWDRPQELSVYRKELILVLEQVGERIWKDRDGTFWIDSGTSYKVLEAGSLPLICTAALSGLTELHKHGFLHGDVAVRNVRVMLLYATYV